MPPYVASPFGIRASILPGIPAYSLGSFNDRTPPTKLAITGVAITGNVATLTVQLIEGLVPVVGALISVQGTQTTTSGGAPNFNVTNAALTAVSINSTTGAGTVSFALTSSNISTTSDSGSALVLQPEVGDVLTSPASGKQFAMLVGQGLPNNSRDVSWVISTPSAPVSFTANLQIADVDQAAEYTTIDTATAAGVRVVLGVRANFILINISAVSGGTNPSFVGKILV